MQEPHWAFLRFPFVTFVVCLYDITTYLSHFGHHVEVEVAVTVLTATRFAVTVQVVTAYAACKEPAMTVQT